MVTITGGTVSVEDCVKHPGYPDPQFAPTRKVRVELIFAEGDGLDEASARANAKVKELLGGKIAAPASTSAAPSGKDALAKAAGVDAASVAAATATAPRKAGARKAADKPKPVETATADAAAVVDEEETGEEADDFSAVVEEEPKPAGKVIPDADLNAAMTKKNGEIKSSASIRKVVAGFAPEGHKGPFHAHDIPQERREEFLKAIADLKAPT
ncbi:MAG: hypothetical protein ACREQ5_02770 [Candidatus Dormibacteria bacterium]